MAVNRFSPIQGLPEWQPQIPLELLAKSLIYKQELFDKNKSLLQSNVQTSSNVADDILNEEAKKYAKDKVNNYKTYLNTNLAYADLTDDSVMAQADTKLGDLANDDIFVNNVYITKKAKDSMKKYQEAKEKGDGSYSAANEWFTNTSIQKYASADLNASKDAKIIGYTRNVDYLKIMQDALKDIKDFNDVTIEFNDNGYYFMKNKVEVLDADKVMARIKPYLTPEVEGQMYRDALYKNQDDASFFKTKAEQYKGSKEMIENAVSKLEKEVAMNPGNSRVVAQKKEIIKKYKEDLKGLDEDLMKVTDYKNMSEEDKNNLKVQAYRSTVLNNVVASHTYKRIDQDIEWNQFALKKYEQDRMDDRVEMEYNLSKPALYNTTIPANEDLSSYGIGDYKTEREKSWSDFQNTDKQLAQELERLHVQAGGTAGSFFSNGVVNRKNLDTFIKTHQFGKFTGQSGNATMEMPAVKALLAQRTNAEKTHNANRLMYDKALEQAGKEMGIYVINPYQSFANKAGKRVTTTSIIANALGVSSLEGIDADDVKNWSNNKTAIIAKVRSEYGDGAANVMTNFLNQNTTVKKGTYKSGVAYGSTAGGMEAGASQTRDYSYVYPGQSALETRAAEILRKTKQEQVAIAVGGIGMRYDKEKGDYKVDQMFALQLATAARISDSKELREYSGNISQDDTKVEGVYEKNGVYNARVIVSVKDGDKKTYKTLDIPVKDPAMLTTVKDFQLKQSDYTRRVENYMVPDPTRLGTRMSTRSIAGALDSKDGYIKFTVEERVVGGVKQTAFIPLDNQTGHWNEEIGNALNTGRIGYSPENILNFIDWAEQNGHRQMGSYDIGKLTKAFLDYNNSPVPGPQGRVTSRTTKTKSGGNTSTVKEKYIY